LSRVRSCTRLTQEVYYDTETHDWLPDKTFLLTNIQFLGNRGIVEKRNFWCIMVYGEAIAVVGNMAMVLGGIVMGYDRNIAVWAITPDVEDDIADAYGDYYISTAKVPRSMANSLTVAARLLLSTVEPSSEEAEPCLTRLSSPSNQREASRRSFSHSTRPAEKENAQCQTQTSFLPVTPIL